MVYKAAIFDLDGTLVHTTPEHRYQLVGRTLRDLRIKFTNKDIDRLWFETKRDKIIKENFGTDPKLFWKVYLQYDIIELRRKFTKLYEDIGFIKELKQKDFKTGILTGAPVHIADFEIEMLGKENFDAIIIANRFSVIKPKPHPHGLEECLSLLGVQKDKAIYVGNAEEDIITAKNAQVFDVLIKRGEYEFNNIQPSLIINSLYELRKLFN